MQCEVSVCRSLCLINNSAFIGCGEANWGRAGRVILNMSDTVARLRHGPRLAVEGYYSAECVDYPVPDSGVLILTITIERETGNIRE